MLKQELIDLVKYFEGFHRQVKLNDQIMAVPYLCPANFWTIGVGRLCNKDHSPITLKQGEEYLLEDLTKSYIFVVSLIKVKLNENQLAALTSFVFNLGSGRFKSSTMRSKINRGELNEIPNELRKWVYGGGRKLKGLVLRREAEILLWNRS